MKWSSGATVKSAGPRSKKTIAARRTLVFVDESNFYPLHAVLRIWAPVGQTSIVREHLMQNHLSAISGMTAYGNLY